MHRQKHSDEAKEKMRQAHLGRRVSPATEFKKGQKLRLGIPGLKEENSPSWSLTPSYSGIHQWISRKMGRPKKCTNCAFISENGRQFHWANISGNYLRDTADWIRLCASCHYKMDKVHEKSWRTRHALSNNR